MDGTHTDYSPQYGYDMWGAAKPHRTSVEILYKSVDAKDGHYQLTKHNAVYITHISFAGLIDQIKCQYDSNLWDVESSTVIDKNDMPVGALSESSLNKILGGTFHSPYEGGRVQITLRRKRDAAGFAAFHRAAAERHAKKMEDNEKGWRAAEKRQRQFQRDAERSYRESNGLGRDGEVLRPAGGARDSPTDYPAGSYGESLHAMLSLHNRLSRLESELGCNKP